VSKRIAKIGKRHFTVEESIFHRKVLVFLNHSGDEVDAVLNHGFDKVVYQDSEEDRARKNFNFSGFSTAVSFSDEPTKWVIAVRDFQWTIKDQGTLIHEIIHTIIKIFETNSIPLNLDTQEFFAHDVSNLYEAIAVKLIPRKKKY
jgi:hypothetical protein